MRRFSVLLSALAVAVALVGCAGGDDQVGQRTASESTSGARWLVTDLGTLPGGRSSEAAAINERGQVAGISDIASRNEYGDPIVHPFLWEDRTMVDLGTFPGTITDIDSLALNDRGQVVGQIWSGFEDGVRHGNAFIWEEGVLSALGTLGEDSSRPTDINERGQVVGVAGGYVPFLWEDGTMVALSTLVGAEANYEGADPDVNDRGHVTGSRLVDDGWSAFVWEDGDVTDLGWLPGGWESCPLDINDNGDVVGRSDDEVEDFHTFLWRNGEMTDIRPLLEAAEEEDPEGLPYEDDGCWMDVEINDLGQILGPTNLPSKSAVLWENGKLTRFGADTWASDINDSGLVVGGTSSWSRGSGDRASRETHAFVWENGRMTDLGTLGGRSSWALAMNESGQIVGWSETKSGARHAVLWTLER